MVWDGENLTTDGDRGVLESQSEEEPGRIKVKSNEKAKRYIDSDAPLLTWKQSHRDSYLNWHLVTEGRGRLFSNLCSRCKTPNPKFRCLDCFGLRIVCQGCVLKSHADEPLHRIQEWSSDYFKPTTLKNLGLRYQLGHYLGVRCTSPVISSQDFVVMDWNGLHSIILDFCGCDNQIAPHLQLMEVGWWPSSYKEPRSAATFCLLRNFHLTNLQCQTPPTDFVQVLEQIIDGTGLAKQPDREAQFLLMLRQWRHIKTAKRNGRGHDPSGITGTTYGSATVACQACPHPEMNLLSGWEKAAADDRFLYTLFVAEDANFKQKARSRPNDHRDPPLGPGWGAFVPNDIYMDEVRKRTNQEEISHCVGFQAIASANTKKSKGLRATGIGSVTCARHETFRPNGTGDLQVGERYSNMDFLALRNLTGCGLQRVLFSYDIACQWMRNFYARMREFPSEMTLPESLSLIFKVPKFHLPAHGLAFLAKFAFNYTVGVGKTDGEAIERIWSWLNGCARSLSMMTAGARWDTMDDFMNYWNYRKTVNLESSLVKKIVAAMPEAVINARAFSAFTEALKEDYEKEITEWQLLVVRWEQGLSDECPYNVTEPDITVAKVKKALAEEDHQREIAGEGSTVSTASSVVIEGLDIEDSQYVDVVFGSPISITTLYRQHLLAMLQHKNLTEVKKTAIQKRRTALLQRIRKFYASLCHLIPGIQKLADSELADNSDHPESLKSFLPSTLDPAMLRPNPSPDTSPSLTCPTELILLEDRLRFAQAHEALSRLRAQLRARTVAYKKSSRVVASQSMYLKTRTLQDQIEAKVKALSETYRRARAALLTLRGEGDWMLSLRELRPEDVRGISERLLRSGEKEQLQRDQERAGMTADEISTVLNGTNVPTVPVNSMLSLGQSKEHLSWIWFTHRVVVEGGGPMTSISGEQGADFEELQECLHSEWCKARARSQRPREELRLVEEEMRRSIQFCYHQARWWERQIGQRPDVSPWLQEGLTAYAKEHIDTELRRAAKWEESWAPIRMHSRHVLQILSDPKFNAILPTVPLLEVEIDMDEGMENLIDDDV
ncbi:hypothetical protein PQX77_013717 [Marasmius sp. AFHP31]|nr:hypothetical protein PQX77_013717 [Marasmius sp. AFHP31]